MQRCLFGNMEYWLGHRLLPAFRSLSQVAAVSQGMKRWKIKSAVFEATGFAFIWKKKCIPTSLLAIHMNSFHTPTSLLKTVTYILHCNWQNICESKNRKKMMLEGICILSSTDITQNFDFTVGLLWFTKKRYSGWYNLGYISDIMFNHQKKFMNVHMRRAICFCFWT